MDEERNAMYLRLLDDIRKTKRETGISIDNLQIKLAALAAEEKAITKLLSHDEPKKERRATKMVMGRILSALESGEFSVVEICDKFGLDQENYRSYFSILYRTHRLGRRSFNLPKTQYYKYATEEWYKSQGITDYAIHKHWASKGE